MGMHSRDTMYFAVMMARHEDDSMAGYQAYRMVRGADGKSGTHTFVGPVRETYWAAKEDADSAREGE
jgi:hypothetical protein